MSGSSGKCHGLVLQCLATVLAGFTLIASPARAQDNAGSPPANRPLDRGEIARAVDEYLDFRIPEQEPSGLEQVFERLTVFGDMRLRFENSFKLDDQQDRVRGRLRLRLGANYELNEEILVGMRLVTGDRSDPNSPHVTFGDGNENLEISLDRVFASYRPGWLEGAEFTAGKFNHAFYANPVYGELIWDADVQPEGASAYYSVPGSGFLTSIGVRVAEYVLIEQGNADDATSTVGQIEARFRWTQDWTTRAAVGYYYYTDTTPDGSNTLLADNAGNAVRDTDGDGVADDFVSAFAILHPVLSVGYTGWSMPVQVAAEYVHNYRAAIDGDSGWAFGVAVGETASQGDWRSYYQFQIIEQDAVFSPFAQDDFLFQTNHRSHLLGTNYQLLDQVGLHLWALVSQREHRGNTPTTDSDRFQWRVRLDLNIKF